MTDVRRRVDALEKRIGTDSVTLFVYDKDTEAKARAAVERGDSGTLVVQGGGYGELLGNAQGWHIVKVAGIDLREV